MERTLSLVLDKDGYVSLTLEKMDNFELDRFTSKKFQNSDEIREYYKDEIDYYLAEKGDYIDYTERNGRKNNGRIVLIETHGNPGEIPYLKRQAVLYKKHVDSYTLNEILKNKLVIKKYIELDNTRVNENKVSSLVSPFLRREVKYSSFKSQNDLKKIKSQVIKKDDSYFERIRLIIKAYNILKREKGYKKIESIYNDKIIKKQIAQKLKEEEQDLLMQITARKNDKFHRENDGTIMIDGFKYSEDDIPFDLDNLPQESEYKPDGLGK